MQLFVRGTETHVFDLSECESVQHLKKLAAQAEGASVDDVMLYHGGQPLANDVSLAGMDINTLDLEVRLLGGKVHGSLARAGKVKGQTPKVEAGEKKKKKTGRAKRRLQYNRRFVNVVQTFGRKKGPNSNS